MATSTGTEFRRTKPGPWLRPAVQSLGSAMGRWVTSTYTKTKLRMSGPPEQLMRHVCVVSYLTPEEAKAQNTGKRGYCLKVRIGELVSEDPEVKKPNAILAFTVITEAKKGGAPVLDRYKTQAHVPALEPIPYEGTCLLYVTINEEIYRARDTAELHFVDLFVKFNRHGQPVRARLIGSRR